MKIKKVIDTSEFMHWSLRKYNMTNNEWHKKIWRPFMCELFMGSSSSIGFAKIEKPTNVFEEHMNEFIDEFSNELGSTIWMEFTN